MSYQYLAGNLKIEQVGAIAPLAPFDEKVLGFLASLSQALLKNGSAKVHPELVALGFWLRAANLNKVQGRLGKHIYKALGCVAHYTPRNVDTMFVYSWVCSLLMGNLNIVRVSNTESVVKAELLQQLNELFELAEHKDIALRNSFVYFDHSHTDGHGLSKCADARVIWGGDETVNTIRQLPTKPRCRDVSFADRYSAFLIDGGKLESLEQCEVIAKGLVKDIEPFSQQACSSPRIVFWLGSACMQECLFKEVDELLNATEQNQRASQLATSQYFQASGLANRATMYNRLVVQQVDNVEPELFDGHTGQSFCLIKGIHSLDELSAFLDEKLQTLSYWGVSEDALLKLIQNPSIKGIDRVVQVGHALDFSDVWDGYQLLSQLSRTVTLEVS